MILASPSPEEIAREADEAIQAAPMAPGELFKFLIREGIIDRNGKVLVCRMFGDEPNSAAPAATNGAVQSPAKQP